MDIVVNEDIKAYIDPLTEDEYLALERSILAEGCRDALVLWGNVLVDGHNRHAICTKHGLPYRTLQSTRFQSIEDVHLWMIDQHLGRRSLSDFQRGVLALRKREIGAQRRSRGERAAAPAPQEGAGPAEASPARAEAPQAMEGPESREALARVARLSSSQVLQIEKIQKQGAPEVVAAVKAGDISIRAAATVATLPLEEQVAAAAGGRDHLKQAAKRVREARRKPAAETAASRHAGDDTEDTLESLRRRVAELTTENQALRRQLAALRDGAEADCPF